MWGKSRAIRWMESILDGWRQVQHSFATRTDRWQVILQLPIKAHNSVDQLYLCIRIFVCVADTI